VPEADRDGNLAAYARLMEDPDPLVRTRAASAWVLWEDAVVSLEPNAKQNLSQRPSTGRPAGTGAYLRALLRPVLTRMLNEGWLADGWEDAAATGGKRPPRRYYELTAAGHLALGCLLQEARNDARFRGLNFGWAM